MYSTGNKEYSTPVLQHSPEEDQGTMIETMEQ